jgi:hypothetical protein
VLEPHPGDTTLVFRIALGFVALLLAAQLVRVERDNPPVQGEVPAPPEVRAILERSCYDCHSRKTRWPWYAHVAPTSWLVTHDVHHARRHLDFTAWDTYSEKKRAKRLREAWHEVKDGEMPLWYYLPMHPAARLSDADRTLLHEWTRAAAGPVPPGADSPAPEH